MNQRKLVIRFPELPVRSSKLDPEVYSKIFGGCLGYGVSCNSTIAFNACCFPFTCMDTGNGSGECIMGF